MNNPDDIFGSDILLDEDGQAVIAANGEMVWADGERSAIQDLWLRLVTPLGGLFYDRGFGSTIPNYIKADSTKANRLSLAAEAKRRLGLDPRVLTGSATAAVTEWDEKQVTLDLAWTFWETEEPQNLTVTLTRTGMERVVEDVAADG